MSESGGIGRRADLGSSGVTVRVRVSPFAFKNSEKPYGALIATAENIQIVQKGLQVHNNHA